MIAGRLRWREPGEKAGLGPQDHPRRRSSSSTGRSSSPKPGRRSGRRCRSSAARRRFARSIRAAIEPLDATLDAFRAALTRENHTLKRALTDPHLFSGIGNAYSDEILHAARLSPLKLTHALDDAEIAALHDATRRTLTSWIDRLRAAARGGFPEKVTAFHDAMAVHGRFKQPCPVCGSPVQRIVYADNECNYCATCQTGGRLLADRSLSRLLKDDWPRRLE